MGTSRTRFGNLVCVHTGFLLDVQVVVLFLGCSCRDLPLFEKWDLGSQQPGEWSLRVEACHWTRQVQAVALHSTGKLGSVRLDLELEGHSQYSAAACCIPLQSSQGTPLDQGCKTLTDIGYSPSSFGVLESSSRSCGPTVRPSALLCRMSGHREEERETQRLMAVASCPHVSR